MSRIDDLIRELCPDGVPFKTLGEVADYSRTRVDGALLDEHSFVGVDNLRPNRGGRVESSFVPSSGQVSQYLPGDVLIGNIRPYLKKIWLAAGSGGHSGDVLSVRIRFENVGLIEPRFLYQLLASDLFFAYDTKFAKGAAMPRGDKAMILKYKIPVPPVEVQREIVRVLDLFQTLEAELEAELEARRRQYAYYRNQLLSFAEAPQRVRWVSMGELYESSSGLSKNADQFGFGQPFLSFKTVFNNLAVPSELQSLVNSTLAEQGRYSVRAGDVFVTRTSEDIDGLGMACAALVDYPKATFNGFTKRLRPKRVGAIDAQFAAYCFRSSLLRRQIAKKAILSTRVSLNDEILLGLRIPLPPLDEQRRIVSILDKFDALVNDLSIGLPAELEARRQQYGYYRDRLLTFQEVA
ncbi:MAG TPA: restriction endonuclease subunit S [Lacisediminihabitans sp.]|uniref:restriction endonuclease subunit S n=1 Tax=Lacisediminihabitans sp. TaxID=2787631 RepID=UPI002ED92497